MLDKIRQTPLKVMLSAAFLLAMFTIAMWLIPPLGITIVVSIATMYSVITILTYWDSQR